MRRLTVLALLALTIGAQGQTQSNQTYTLKATPKTAAWGYYDAKAEPVLHIKSGDTVVFETLLTNSPTGLEKAGLPPEQVEQNLRDIYKEITTHDPGGHILNGPVYIEGAEPGDTLEIHIQKIDLAIPDGGWRTLISFCMRHPSYGCRTPRDFRGVRDPEACSAL